MEPIESYERAGCVVSLHYDEYPSSPREWTNLGTLITWGRDRGWGDVTRDYEPMDSYYEWSRFAVDLRTDHGATVVLPVWLHNYGGGEQRLRVGTVGDWLRIDRAPDGAIFDTPDGRAICGTPPELVEEALRGEIAVLDEWVRGAVSGFVVERDGAVIDSCWGFYGDDGLREARAEADAAADHEGRVAAQLASYEYAH